jgi:segregation and condensation protein B
MEGEKEESIKESASQDETGFNLPEHLLVEAALFTAGKPVSLEDISVSTGIDISLVALYIKKLISSYSRRETSLEVIKAGKKYSLRIREPYVERISALAEPEVSPKLLKTAALIAYHQPMKQADLVEMYGSKIYDHVKELVSLGLVRTRKEGSTKILTTTHRFSEVFGISSISKKKVKDHVKERVLTRIERITLDGYGSNQDVMDSGKDGEDKED